MLKIDNNLLVELGLSSLPDAEKNSFLKHIYETLEMRVGIRLADQMSNEQLDEFEQYFEAKDDTGAFKWLETNFPNYKDIVQEEFDKLKNEVSQSAPQILAASQQASQAATQPGMPPVSGPQAPAPQPPSPDYGQPQQPQPQAPMGDPYASAPMLPTPMADPAAFVQPSQMPPPQPMQSPMPQTMPYDQGAQNPIPYQPVQQPSVPTAQQPIQMPPADPQTQTPMLPYGSPPEAPTSQPPAGPNAPTGF
jgi:hypothetical protein